MSISATSSATATTSTASTTSSSSLSQDEFLSLLVSQLQNQNPLDAMSTDKILDQMLSYASYSSQTDTAETLSQISATLDSIATALDITV